MAVRSYSRILVNGFNLQIVSHIHDSLYCSICANVLNEPQQTLCGCRFCSECINPYLSTDSKCPGDTEECLNVQLRDNLRLDHAAKRDVNKLIAKCPFEGCEVENEVLKMKEHILCCGQEKRLLNVVKKINLCDDENINDTESKTVDVSCNFCDDVMEKERIKTIHWNFEHEDICEKYNDYCPNECGVKEKVVWKEHRKVCTAEKLLCPYEKLGCESVLRKAEMKEHLLEDAYKHTEVLLKHIDNLNNEITTLRTELKNVNQTQTLIPKPSESFVSNNLQNIEFRVNNVTDRLNFTNGVLFWKIRNFDIGRRQTLFSPMFYTGQPGYRMQLELVISEDPFLSIYAKLVRGGYDDNLEWPFRGRVIIRIFDQEYRNRNYAQTVYFMTAPKRFCKRPRGRYVEGYGVPEFICLNQLSFIDYLYCDNELWIDCFVDKID